MRVRRTGRDRLASDSVDPNGNDSSVWWELAVRSIHWALLGLAVVIGALSGQTSRPPEYLETVAGLFALLAIFLRFALWKTQGAATLREAIFMLFHGERVVEPALARRLSYAEGGLWLLLVPAFYFLAIERPSLSLIVMVFMGAARFFARKVRVKTGGRPEAADVVQIVVYGGMLLISLASTVLWAIGP